MTSGNFKLVRTIALGALIAFAAACNKPPEPAATPKPAAGKPVAEVPVKDIKPELPPLFRDIERRTFQFFWDTTNELNGLTPDRFPSRPFASIASVGFSLTAY